MRMWTAFFLSIFLTFLARVSTAPLEKGDLESNGLHKEELLERKEVNDNSLNNEDESTQFYNDIAHEIETTEKILLTNVALYKRSFENPDEKVSDIDDVVNNRKKDIMDKLKPKRLVQIKPKDEELEKPNRDSQNNNKKKALDDSDASDGSIMDLSEMSISIGDNRGIMSEESAEDNMDIDSVENDLTEDPLNDSEAEDNEKLLNNNITPKLKKSSKEKLNQAPQKLTEPIEQNTKPTTDKPNNSIISKKNKNPETISQISDALDSTLIEDNSDDNNNINLKSTNLPEEQANKNTDDNSEAQDMFKTLSSPKKIEPYKSNWDPTTPLISDNDFLNINSEIPVQNTLEPSEKKLFEDSLNIETITNNNITPKLKKSTKGEISKPPQKFTKQIKQNTKPTTLKHNNSIVSKKNNNLEKMSQIPDALDSTFIEDNSDNNNNINLKSTNLPEEQTNKNMDDNSEAQDLFKTLSSPKKIEPYKSNWDPMTPLISDNDFLNINSEIPVQNTLEPSEKKPFDDSLNIETITNNNITPKLQKSSKGEIIKPPRKFTKQIKQNTKPISHKPNNSIVSKKNKNPETISQIPDALDSTFIEDNSEDNNNINLKSTNLPEEQANKNTDDNSEAQDMFKTLSSPKKIEPYKSNWDPTTPLISDNDFLNINSEIPVQNTLEHSEKKPFDDSLNIETITNNNITPKLKKSPKGEISKPPQKFTKQIKQNTKPTTLKPNNSIVSKKNNNPEKMSQIPDALDSTFIEDNSEDNNNINLKSTNLPEEQANKNTDDNSEAQDMFKTLSSPKKIEPYKSNWDPTTPLISDNDFLNINSEIPVQNTLEHSEKKPFDDSLNIETITNNNITPKLKKSPKGEISKPPQKFTKQIKQNTKPTTLKPNNSIVSKKNNNPEKMSQIPDALDSTFIEDNSDDNNNINLKSTNLPEEQTNKNMDDNSEAQDLFKTLRSPKKIEPYKSNWDPMTPLISDNDFLNINSEIPTPTSFKPIEEEQDSPTEHKDNNLMDNKNTNILTTNDSMWGDQDKKVPDAPNIHGIPQSKSSKLPFANNLQRPTSKGKINLKPNGQKPIIRQSPLNGNNNSPKFEYEILAEGTENSVPEDQGNDSMLGDQDKKALGASNIHGIPQSKSSKLPFANNLQRPTSKGKINPKPYAQKPIIQKSPLNVNNNSPKFEYEKLSEGTENSVPEDQGNDSMWGDQDKKVPVVSDLSDIPQYKSDEMADVTNLQRPNSKEASNLNPIEESIIKGQFPTTDDENSPNIDYEELAEGTQNSVPKDQDKKVPGASNIHGIPQSKSSKMTNAKNLQRPTSKGKISPKPYGQKPIIRKPPLNNKNISPKFEYRELAEGTENSVPDDQGNDSMWGDQDKKVPVVSDLSDIPQYKSDEMADVTNLQRPNSKEASNLNPIEESITKGQFPTTDDENSPNIDYEELAEGTQNSVPKDQDKKVPGASNIHGIPQSKSSKMTNANNLQRPTSKGKINPKPNGQKPIIRKPPLNNNNISPKFEYRELAEGTENSVPDDQGNDSMWGDQDKKVPVVSDINDIPQSKSDDMADVNNLQRPNSKEASNLNPIEESIIKGQFPTTDDKNSPNIDYEELAEGTQNSVPKDQDKKVPGASNIHGIPQSKSSKMTNAKNLQRSTSKGKINPKPYGQKPIIRKSPLNNNNNSPNIEYRELAEGTENSVPEDQGNDSMWGDQDKKIPVVSDINDIPQSKSDEIADVSNLQRLNSKEASNLNPIEESIIKGQFPTTDDENSPNIDYEELAEGTQNSVPKDQDKKVPDAPNIHGIPQSKSSKLPFANNLQRPTSKGKINLKPNGQKPIIRQSPLNGNNNSPKFEYEKLAEGTENSVPEDQGNDSMQGDQDKKALGASNIHGIPQSKTGKLSNIKNIQNPNSKVANSSKRQGENKTKGQLPSNKKNDTPITRNDDLDVPITPNHINNVQNSEASPRVDSHNIFGDIPMLNIWGTEKSQNDNNKTPKMNEPNLNKPTSPLIDTSSSEPKKINENDKEMMNSDIDINAQKTSDLNDPVTNVPINSEGGSVESKTNPSDDSGNIFGDIPILNSSEETSDNIQGTENPQYGINAPQDIGELDSGKQTSPSTDSDKSVPEKLNEKNEKQMNPEEDNINEPTASDLNNLVANIPISSKGEPVESNTNPSDDSGNIFGDIPILNSSEETSDNKQDTKNPQYGTNTSPDIGELDSGKQTSPSADSDSSVPEKLNENDKKQMNSEKGTINETVSSDLNNPAVNIPISSEGKPIESKKSPSDDSGNIFGDIPILNSNEETSNNIQSSEKPHYGTNVQPNMGELDSGKQTSPSTDSDSFDPEKLNEKDGNQMNPEEDTMNEPTIVINNPVTNIPISSINEPTMVINNPETNIPTSSEGEPVESKTNPADNSGNIFGDIPILNSSEETSDNMQGTQNPQYDTNAPPDISELDSGKQTSPSADSDSSVPEKLNEKDEKQMSPEEDNINESTASDLNNPETNIPINSEGEPVESKKSPSDDSGNIFGDIPILNSSEETSDNIQGTENPQYGTNAPPDIGELDSGKQTSPSTDSDSSVPEKLNEKDEKQMSPEEDNINESTASDLNNPETNIPTSSEGEPVESKKSPSDDSGNIFGDIPILNSSEEISDDIQGTGNPQYGTNAPPDIGELDSGKQTSPSTDSDSSVPEKLNEKDEKQMSPEEDNINESTASDLNNPETNIPTSSEGEPIESKTNPADNSGNIFGDIPILNSSEETSDNIQGTENPQYDTNAPPDIGELDLGRQTSPSADSDSSVPEKLNEKDEKQMSPEEDNINESTASDLNNPETNISINSEGEPVESKKSPSDDSGNIFGDIPILNSSEETSDNIQGTENPQYGTNTPPHISELDSDKPDLLTIDSPDSKPEEVIDNVEKPMDPKENTIHKSTESNLTDPKIEKSTSSGGDLNEEITDKNTEKPQHNTTDDTNSPDLNTESQLIPNVTSPSDKIEKLNEDISSKPSDENEKNRDNSMFNIPKIGLPKLFSPSKPENKKPIKSNKILKSNSINKFGDISIISPSKKNTDEIGNSGLSQPTKNKDDNSNLPIEKVVNNYTSGNQSNTYKEKNPNEFKNSASNFMDKSSSGPSKLSGDDKLQIPSADSLTKLVKVPDSSILDTNHGVEPSNGNQLMDQVMQLLKSNSPQSPDFSMIKGSNPFGSMLPKFKNNYEGGNSNYDLWESLPPKQKKISNENEKLSSFNNDVQTIKPMTGSYHNNAVSNNINFEKNLDNKTENLDKKTENLKNNDDKLNSKNEMYDDFIKKMTEKVLEKIDNIDSKISKLEKINNDNNINSKDNVKLDDLKINDSSSGKKQTSKPIKVTKKKIETISSDSTFDKSSNESENLNSNESDEINDIKEPKITKKIKNSKKKKEKDNELRKSHKNSTKNKNKDRENRKKNDYDDTELEKRKGKKGKSKKRKEITSSSVNNSSEIKDITSDESINESHESIEDLKNKRKPKKTINKNKKKVSKTKTKHIKSSKKRNVGDDFDDDEETNLNKNNYDEEENYESNIVINDDKQTKKSKKRIKNKNIVKKKNIENNIIKTENETEITKNSINTDTNNGGDQLVYFYPQYAYTNPFSRLLSKVV